VEPPFWIVLYKVPTGDRLVCRVIEGELQPHPDFRWEGPFATEEEARAAVEAAVDRPPDPPTGAAR
jgi:hypothetical protein